MFSHTIDLIYLFSAVCFIVGIKMLSSPETAAKGNYLSAFAMLLAVGITLITGNAGQDCGFELDQGIPLASPALPSIIVCQ